MRGPMERSHAADAAHPLLDRVAVITGGSRGIGRATAVRFARAGAAVVIAGRSEATGRSTADEILASGGRAVFVPCDVAVASDVIRLIGAALEAFGGVDALVNNAGISGQHALLETTEDE